ncbi:MAG: hypothetical protein Q8P20_08240 [bacterium]|nr:hypothetical protein [bacterium]
MTGDNFKGPRPPEVTGKSMIKHEMPSSGLIMRPTREGSMDHLFVTDGDLPITGEMRMSEILQVNWDQVVEVIKQAELSVRHEAQLNEKELTDVVNVIALAVRKLGHEDGELEAVLRQIKPRTLTELIISLFPERGRKIREGARMRGQAKKGRESLAEVNQQLTDARISLAKAVDDRIHQLLLSTDKEYYNLHIESQKNDPKLLNVEEMIKDLNEWINALTELNARGDSMSYEGRKFINAQVTKNKNKVYSFIDFCIKNHIYIYGTEDGRRKNTVFIPRDPGTIKSAIEEFYNKLQIEKKLVFDKMSGLRDQKKEELYKK